MKTIKLKSLFIFTLAPLLLLLVPLVAMQFTNEVKWDLMDFIIMGLLLSGTSLICGLIISSIKNRNYRVIICVAVILLFLLIWAELAVGIFGTPFAGS